MRTRMLLGLAVLAVSLPVQAQPPPPDERSPAYVGEVYIIGNRFTRDDVIRRQIPLLPGQILCYPDIRRAEEQPETPQHLPEQPATWRRDRPWRSSTPTAPVRSRTSW